MKREDLPEAAQLLYDALEEAANLRSFAEAYDAIGPILDDLYNERKRQFDRIEEALTAFHATQPLTDKPEEAVAEKFLIAIIRAIGALRQDDAQEALSVLRHALVGLHAP